jgi:hypothetical protein
MGLRMAPQAIASSRSSCRVMLINAPTITHAELDYNQSNQFYALMR